MRKKQILVLIVIVLFFNISGLPFIAMTVIGSTEAPIIAEPLRIGDKFRKNNYPIDFSSAPGDNGDNGNGGDVTPDADYEVIDGKWWLTLDDYNGYYFFDYYELWDVGLGDIAEIWIQYDRSWLDPDPQGREYPEITGEQVEYLLEEFETNIYPTDTDCFGTPDYHNGTYSLLVEWEYFPPGYYEDVEGKNVVLVSNVRDDNYYTDYPYYIAGFYSPSYEEYFDRNIINIDSYQWEERIGPDGSRPYLYESVIAHEYQHLIHDDYNPNDDLWMNEACSMYAEPLCGYPIDFNHINSFLYTPDNSLTEWGDQGDINILADYGAVFLWSLYLSDQYGGPDFLGHFVQAGIPGIDGLNVALEYFGYKKTFEDVFHDWRIANLIYSDHPGNGKYNYESIDLSEANEEVDQIMVHEIEGYPVPWTWGTDFGTTKTILGYDTGISTIGPYASDYINFKDLKDLSLLFFDGDDIAYIPGWELIDGDWYSGAYNLMNALIMGEAYVDPANPTLELYTYWDIEDYWDFGFVQVSTDDGETWTSLENEYTIYDHDTNAHPDIVANLPGLTSWSGFITPGGWLTMEFDLTPYAGETVLIGFRYMTDWAFLYEGWFISDDVHVSGVTIDLSPFYPEADFMVTVIERKTLPNEKVKYKIGDMNLLDESEKGLKLLPLSRWEDVILIVSPIMPKGFVDYKFMTEELKTKWRK